MRKFQQTEIYYLENWAPRTFSHAEINLRENLTIRKVLCQANFSIEKFRSIGNINQWNAWHAKIPQSVN